MHAACPQTGPPYPSEIMRMAASSKRILWKGAITFGLVHIPVALHSATSDQGLNFDWLDKRSMDPVGYKRINKRTGEEISSDNIVKGIEYEDGQYVILSPEEIQAAYPKTTQTIEIESFVDAHEVPMVFLERPYYISPINRGAKVYALLREILRKTGKVGIAKVVIQTKQHLAMLAPSGPALVLDLLRWGEEIRSWDELNLPEEGVEAVGITAREMAMAEQLVTEMSGHFNPHDFRNSFRDQIMELVEDKARAGQTELVRQPENAEAAETGAQIYDLTEMLRRSLNRGSEVRETDSGKAGGNGGKSAGPEDKASADDAPAAPSKKTAGQSTGVRNTGSSRAGQTGAGASQRAVAAGPARDKGAKAASSQGKPKKPSAAGNMAERTEGKTTSKSATPRNKAA